MPWLFVICTSLPLAGQDIESIGREKPFSVNGGIALNQIFYGARGVTARRDAYSYLASGHINFSIYGWSVPLSFGFSNHDATFTQPFNRYSLHPAWRSLTVHAGYASMSFSPYTVNGHIFSGAGIEFSPEGKWKFSALYGRFLKAVEPDSSVRSSPAFQRKGYGFKGRYGDDGNNIDIILFHAEDSKNSIRTPADSVRVTPHENLVLSIGASVTLLKKLIVRGELAGSALTRDVRTEKTQSQSLLARSGMLFEPRLTSSYYQALKTSVDYQHNGWVIGGGYERIDPEYRTLGAYYFNNDLENITLNTSTALQEGKLNIAVSAGVQRDNLDKAKISTMRRIVSSLHATYAPSPRGNFSGSWSSFQTYTHIRSQFININPLTPYENLDTLNFTQISRNASLSGIYLLPGTENRKQHVNVSVTWQKAEEDQGGPPHSEATMFYNIHVAYTISLPQKKAGASLAFHTAINDGARINTRMMGPVGSITKSFFNSKVRSTLSFSWNKTYTNGSHPNSVINGRFTALVPIKEKHTINMSAVFVNRTLSERRSAIEFTALIGYNYAFASNPRTHE